MVIAMKNVVIFMHFIYIFFFLIGHAVTFLEQDFIKHPLILHISDWWIN